MRGLLFTEFLSFAEGVFEIDVLEDAIEAADLPSGGAYASTGHYPYQELVDIIAHLPMDSVGGVEAGMQAFGQWLAGRFKSSYRHFFERHTDAISFLDSIDDHIHVEVRKLYPQAVPPRVKINQVDSETVLVSYESHRPFATVALGLTIGSLEAYGGHWAVYSTAMANDQKACQITLKKKQIL